MKGKPSAIIWKTFKGHGLGEEIADKLGWHGKVFGDKTQAMVDAIESKLSGNPMTLTTHAPALSATTPKAPKVKLPELKYEKGQKVATRNAFGTAIKSLSDQSDLIIVIS
jgi:transketolase